LLDRPDRLGRRTGLMHESLAQPQRNLTGDLDGTTQQGFRCATEIHRLDRRLPVTGAQDVVSKEVAIVGEHLATLAGSRDRDVELFAVDGSHGSAGSHNQDLFHSLALGRMRGDCVTVGEGAKILLQDPAVRQVDAIAAIWATSTNSPLVNPRALACSRRRSPDATFNRRLPDVDAGCQRRIGVAREPSARLATASLPPRRSRRLPARNAPWAWWKRTRWPVR
jgi:hypothetical protein